MTREISELEQLTALLLGSLDDEAAGALRARLDGEPELRRSYERLRASAAFLQAEAHSEPSTKAIKKARRLLRDARPGLIEKLSGGVQQIIAVLDFDTRLTPAVAGIRGAGGSAQVAFSCEHADLDIEISACGENLWSVGGQIDADEDGDWSVTIVDGAGTATDIVVDAKDGAFKAKLPAGSYELLLRRDALEIKVCPLQIP